MMAGMMDRTEAIGVGEVSTSALVDTKAVQRRGHRRRWSEDQKRSIVAESLVVGASVSVVARRHDINANLLFKWRLRYRSGLSPRGAGEATALLPVRLQGAMETCESGGLIEVVLASGICVRLRGSVDGSTLRQVLDGLR